MVRRTWILLLLALALPVLAWPGPPRSAAQAGPDLGFEVPPGFEVSLYADDSLATDIFALTIDARGRVVVAGQGHVKVLEDTDGDGKADKATLFADFPKSGAHGMYFDGNDLICTGDKGVRRLYDTNGTGRCDRVSPVWFPTSNDTEHAANGIVRGPDGWYYLAAGMRGDRQDLARDRRAPPARRSQGEQRSSSRTFTPNSWSSRTARVRYGVLFPPFGRGTSRMVSV
jgi:hypothetical protein